MTSPRILIQRICEETGAQPLELLGLLLEALQQSHTFHAGLSFADAKHPAGVEGEIEGLCQMVAAEKPENLLAALKLAVFAYAIPAAVNARDARARGNDAEAGSLERSVQVGNALRQLLQSCIDDAGNFQASNRPTMHDRAPEGTTVFRTGIEGRAIGQLPGDEDD